MRVSVLSGPEVAALLTGLEKCSTRDQLLIRLMLQCGLRVGEVSALNVEHVWRGGYVHPAINLVQATTKGHKARFVDIPGPVVQLIQDYILQLFVGDSSPPPSSPLFVGLKRGDRLGVSGIGRIVTAISIAALGRSIHPHVLRHTYATILLKYTNIKVIQQLLGHANLATTEIYLHPNSEDCKTAVNQAFN